ncbi:hypothetical protein GOC46_21065 [Sinorhizobium meliloti]|nr:hypothetical protein [Sinorhizobium meliloti]MDX0382677.1 hypothetical protein [Sinorhizobium meliloti]
MAPTEAPNPFFNPTYAGEASNPRTLPAIINVRESAVTTASARGQIDPAQPRR